MGERESRDTAATTRSVNVVHYIERDQDAAARLLASVVDRATGTSADSLTLLVVTPTTDDALAISEAVWSLRRGDGRHVTALTSTNRARRILAARPAAIVASAEVVARLIAESALDLTHLHSVVLVWPEEIVAQPEERSLLERVIGEIPKSSERMAVCAAKSSELAQLLERTMWKARSVDQPAATQSAAAVRILVAPASAQLHALRSALDGVNPASALLLAFNDAGEAKARAAAAVLGDTLVKVSREIPAERVDLAVIVDAVPSAEQLTSTAAITNDVIAIVRPESLSALLRVAPHAMPMTWTGALASARSAQDALRDEIRGFVESGGQMAWVSVLAPLLDQVDAVDAAAAALALLDRERRKAKRAVAAPAAAPAEARPERRERPAPDRTRDARGAERGARDFRRDDRGPRDVRRDERGSRDSRDDRRGRDDRPKRDWSAGRGGSTRDATRDRERSPREGRGARRDDIERVPRAAREGREWSARGERLKNSRRGPRRGAAE